MLKRAFDFIASLGGIIVLSPLFLILWLLIKLSSKGPAVYRQVRVGRFGKDFYLLKFRSMYIGSDKKGQLTVGKRDPRITPIGFFLRKYKLDELPQLFNVLKGDMSLIGPRPEVRKYVELYTAEQLKVLQVRPGITDYASIEYANENELLGKSGNPEEFYIKEVLPAKIKLNMRYIENANLATDIKIIFQTLGAVLRPSGKRKSAS